MLATQLNCGDSAVEIALISDFEFHPPLSGLERRVSRGLSEWHAAELARFDGLHQIST